MVPRQLVILSVRLRLGVLVCALFSAPLVAQTRLSAEDFLSMAEGRTLHFHNRRTGRLVGIEEFLSRTISVWRRREGSCTYGQITIENGLVCFRYDDEPDDRKHCWYMFIDGDTIFARSPEIVGATVQEVQKITEESLNCPDPAIS